MDSEKQPTVMTFGVTIEPRSTPTPPPSSTLQTRQPPALHLKPSKETDLTSSALSTPSHLTPDVANPFSAFYEHNSPNSHSDNFKTPRVYQQDVESQAHFSRSKTSIEPTKDCSMWPSPADLKEQKRLEKNRTSWNPLRRLSKRNRIIAHIFIALCVVGTAVGIGVGVSRAVGGGVWSGRGQTKQIPNNKLHKDS